MRKKTHGTRIRLNGLSLHRPPLTTICTFPIVESRYPLWDRSDPMPVVSGLSHTCRESLVTTVRDAEPQIRFEHPASSIWPFLMAVATGATIIPSIFTPWSYVFGGVLIFLAGLGWFWPKKETGVE